MRQFSTDEYALAGCEFGKSSLPIFLGVYHLTNGNVCIGCAWYHGGQCPAYKKMRFAAEPKTAIQEPQETVRETAVRLGISISEMRRQRRSKP